MVSSVFVYFMFLVVVFFIGYLSKKFPKIYWLKKLANYLDKRLGKLKKFLKNIYKKSAICNR